jgi:SynChlorMet cassette protein ScmD
MINNRSCPIKNPTIVFREESDKWAILFDPDTGEIFGLDPISIFVWQKLDGNNSVADIVDELQKNCAEKLHDQCSLDVNNFINELAAKNLIIYR